MFATLVTGGLALTMFASSIFGSIVEAPNATKVETQIESPSSELEVSRYNLLVASPSLEEIEEELTRMESEKVRQREEVLAQWETIRLEKEAEQARLEAEYVQSKEGIKFNGSYYIAFCSEGCTGKTATGYNVSDTIYYDDMRIIAVDPKVIPLYSIVEVSTPYETFTAIALDKGGAIKGHKIDILVADTKTARKLGRHSVYIKVLEYGK